MERDIQHCGENDYFIPEVFKDSVRNRVAFHEQKLMSTMI